MAHSSSIAFSFGLIGAGAVACALTAGPLVGDPDLSVPLNVFGINRSPYGEVFAMAMQGPIDQTFNHTFDLRRSQSPSAETRSDEEQVSGDCGEPDGSLEAVRVKNPANAGSRPLSARLRGLLEELDVARTAYTNPKPSSPAQKLHIRRDVEDKLRFAYNLDPANYGNYNAYHFFLTEPQLGTRPELTPGAARLAQETIEYCLAETFDPRPSLTAAAAATNILHLMFNDRHNEVPRYTVRDMRRTLGLLDYCIARHNQIHAHWTSQGGHELLSQMRIAEMEDRFSFVIKIRDAAEEAIRRFEGEESNSQASR